jgi:NTP pyrophosphatase (non-canonical NTP hydrolase)
MVVVRGDLVDGSVHFRMGGRMSELDKWTGYIVDKFRHQAENKDVLPDIRRLQAEQSEWAQRNFKNRDPIHPVLGVVEEVGELAHALLKQAQGIRGTHSEHTVAAQDAVGDIVIFLCDVCTQRGWDLASIVAMTWDRVKQRDWTKDSQTGGDHG